PTRHKKQSRTATGTENGRNADNTATHNRFQCDALGAAYLRHHLHGDDRQPAIWMDALRQSDRSEISLGPRSDPSRLHDLRSDRDVAGADRRLFDRQVWPEGDDFR